MSIKDFLGSGETTVYTSRPGLMRKTAAALAIALSFNAIASPFMGSDTASKTNNDAFQTALEISQSGYNFDAQTLLYQSLVDPSLSKIRAVSIESEYLQAFMEQLPQSVSAEFPSLDDSGRSLGEYSAATFRSSFEAVSPSGMALSFHNETANEGPSYCFVRSLGSSNDFDADKAQSEVVSRGNILYFASASQHEAFVLVHELAHCAKSPVVLPGQSDMLSNLFRVAVNELRSDLAVVLYSASQTGSFTEGLSAVGALRSSLSLEPTHATTTILEKTLSWLAPEDFANKQIHELIEDAVSIVTSFSPAQIDELKLEYAKEAFAQRSIIGQGSEGDTVREASAAYARFAGKPFSVDIGEYGSRQLNYSLQNASMNAEVVRATSTFTVEAVHNFAAARGITISPEQLELSRYLANETSSIATEIQPSPINLGSLEISAAEHLKQGIHGVEQGQRNTTQREKLAAGIAALETGLARLKNAEPTKVKIHSLR